MADTEQVDNEINLEQLKVLKEVFEVRRDIGTCNLISPQDLPLHLPHTEVRLCICGLAAVSPAQSLLPHLQAADAFRSR